MVVSGDMGGEGKEIVEKENIRYERPTSGDILEVELTGFDDLLGQVV